ncbi:hypothetical protein ABW19_dt0202862 [Dactylella cylindrospora]|nr:hypothetical protein ABW19_dt0202862 [Dactylella cylindrospora]
MQHRMDGTIPEKRHAHNTSAMSNYFFGPNGLTFTPTGSTVSSQYSPSDPPDAAESEPTSMGLGRVAPPVIDTELRDQKIKYYLNALPAATEKGDHKEVEKAYSQLIALFRQDASDPQSMEKVMTLLLALAGARQVLGKWQLALDALEEAERSPAAMDNDHKVTYYHITALTKLGLRRLGEAEEAAQKALEAAMEVNVKKDAAKNTGLFIMAIIKSQQTDPAEATFYKSRTKTWEELDKSILTPWHWNVFETIADESAVRLVPTPPAAKLFGLQNARYGDSVVPPKQRLGDFKETLRNVSDWLDVMVIYSACFTSLVLWVSHTQENILSVVLATGIIFFGSMGAAFLLRSFRGRSIYGY